MVSKSIYIGIAIAVSPNNSLENRRWEERDMANNFEISMRRTSDSLSIELTGDFDGASADELLDTLQKHLKNTACVCIDTSNLKKIHPFGRDVFANHLFKLKKHHMRMKFVGKNAEQIIPAEMEYLRIDKHHQKHQKQDNSWATIES